VTVEEVSSLREATLKDVHGVILRMEAFDRALMDTAPLLEVIARHGSGLDLIDTGAARDRGITVLNAPEASRVSVAEHAIALMLALAKGLRRSSERVLEGSFSLDGIRLVELDGKALGIVGFGQVGSEVARRAQALGMLVSAYLRPGSRKNLGHLGVRRSPSLEALFSSSDFISLHVPLTAETKGMVTGDLLSIMKSTAFLINTSRGEILDQEALVQALKDGVLAGAALDVFAREPPPLDDPILTLENVILTPHSAALTEEAQKRTSLAVARGVLKVLGAL